MTEYLHVMILLMLVTLVFLGVEVAVSLALVSFTAMWISTGDWEITVSFLSNTAYEALRDYVFAVVPLFLLMGEFIARSGIAYDLFWAIDRWLSRLPARFAYATVLGVRHQFGLCHHFHFYRLPTNEAGWLCRPFFIGID